MKSSIQLLARALLVAMSALVLASCGGSDDDDTTTELTVGAGAPATQEQRSDAFAATLSIEQETQAGTSLGTGSGTVVIDPETRQMTASLTATGLTGSAAIHLGEEGEDGPIIVALVESTPGSGIWSASATLSEAQYQALLNGELYFRVQSPALPNGQFRGQILAQQIAAANGTATDTSSTAGGAAGSGNTTTVESGNNAIIVSSEATGFFAALRGEHVVPSNASTAQGSAAVVIDTSTRQMVAAVATLGITGTAVQVREAAAGSNGPVVISLSETTPGSGVWVTTTTLSTGQYAALRAGNMYFVVLSAAFPEGEIRGQLLPQRQFSTPVASGANLPPATGGTPGITTNNTSGGLPGSRTGGFDATTGGGVTIPGASTGIGGTGSSGGFTGPTGITGNTSGLGGSSGITGTTSFDPVPTGSSIGISSIPNTSTGFDSGFGTTTGTGIGTTSGTGIGSTSNSGLGSTTGTGIGTTSSIGIGTGFGTSSGSTSIGTTF